MRKLPPITIVLSLAILTACSYGQVERNIFQAPTYYTPTPEELQLAEIGQLPKDYESQIRVFMTTQLENPASAQYQFREPRRGYVPARTRAETIFCWIVLADIVTKDVHGEDAGNRTYVFHILNGKIISGEDLAAK